jgi:hypothetical protein
MRYVTYDDAGNLTGMYLQDLQPEHATCHIIVTDDEGGSWTRYRANAGRSGIELTPPPFIPLDQLKASKLAAVNTECDRRMSLLVAGYPEREQQTFPKQEQEARAFTANASAATPMIDALVANRGIDKAELVTRIITKADLFAQYSGAVIGYRQKLEDQIAAAADKVALDMIDPLAGWPA